MPRVKLEPRKSVLVVIDIQPVLTKTIFEADRVLARTTFLTKIALLLGIPVLATEQNPSRMGGMQEEVASLIPSSKLFAKMAFSVAGSFEFLAALKESERTQAVLVGMETHICVSQSAQDLLELGYEVVVCPDAVSSRTLDRHKLGMEQIRDAGVVPAHTEAVAYEWLGSADHPAFRQALQIVKEHP